MYHKLPIIDAYQSLATEFMDYIWVFHGNAHKEQTMVVK